MKLAPNVLALLAATTGTAAASPWTLEVIDRPLTLNGGTAGVEGDVAVRHATFVDEISGMPATSTIEDAGAIARYGITNWLEVGASYVITLDEFEAKGPLGAYALVSVKNTEQLKLAAGAGFTYNLSSKIGEVRGGLAGQYNLTPRLAVFAPPAQLRFTPVTPVGMGKPVPRPLDISLPVGIALQAAPNIFASLQTNLVTIGFQDSGTTFIFADVTPVTASFFYSTSPAVDVGISVVTPDVRYIGDTFAFVATIRLFVL